MTGTTTTVGRAASNGQLSMKPTDLVTLAQEWFLWLKHELKILWWDLH